MSAVSFDSLQRQYDNMSPDDGTDEDPNVQYRKRMEEMWDEEEAYNSMMRHTGHYHGGHYDYD